MRVTIGIPNRDDFKSEMVATLMRMVTQTGALVNLSMPTSCYIDDLRNQCWDDAKAFDSDWLLFMDTDNSIDYAGNAFQEMIALGKDVVSGVYYQKLYPFRPLVYRFTESGLIQNWREIPKAPFTADATGCGLLLISRKVLDAFTPEVIDKYGKPFNFLNYDKPNMLREDPAFCWRIKQLGFELWFAPQIKMGHHGKQKITAEHYEAAKQSVARSEKVHDGGIDGWMSDAELQFLDEKASTFKSIVEIGSWKGRSTKAMLEAGATVYAVDHFQGSDDIKELAQSQNIEAEFDKNVGHYPNLIKMKMASLEAAKMLQDRVDMVFIDAAHDYENCKADIEAWLPKATRIIAGHDYAKGWPGVMKAVNEKFGGRVKVVDSIWYVNLQEA
jgi:predicted O-methyltransferase YrrM